MFVGFDNYLRAFGDTLLHDGVLRVLLFFARAGADHAPDLGARRASPSTAAGSAGSVVIRIGLFLPYAVAGGGGQRSCGAYIFGGQFGLTGADLRVPRPPGARTSSDQD